MESKPQSVEQKSGSPQTATPGEFNVVGLYSRITLKVLNELKFKAMVLNISQYTINNIYNNYTSSFKL